MKMNKKAVTLALMPVALIAGKIIFEIASHLRNKQRACTASLYNFCNGKHESLGKFTINYDNPVIDIDYFCSDYQDNHYLLLLGDKAAKRLRNKEYRVSFDGDNRNYYFDGGRNYFTFTKEKKLIGAKSDTYIDDEYVCDYAYEKTE